MGEVTKFTPRTHAVKKALERYAMLHPAQASANKLDLDIEGFITDMLTDLYLLADEGKFDLPTLMEKARRKATHELKNREITNG